MSAAISYRQEVYRKLIHLSSFWMVALIWFFPYPKMLLVCLFGICLILNLLLEHAYANGNCRIRKIYSFFFGKMLRDQQPQPGQWVVSGAPPVWAAAVLAVLLFPVKIASIALGVMLLADTAAALIGRRYGKHKTVNGKSIEGVAAFCFSGIALSLAMLAAGGFLTGCTAAAAVLGTVLAAGAELFEKQIRLDDNFTIPVITGLCLALCCPV